MPIDFNAPENENTYAKRSADESWLEHMRSLLGDRTIGRVADIGCGGGIYSRAWRSLGAQSVVGLDASAQMVADSRAATSDAAITFEEATTDETGLEGGSCDIVFSRAVIHHLSDHERAFAEAFRILKPGGMVIVQDRTIEDVEQPSSPKHLRGWIFELYPTLLNEERRRRPVTEDFQEVLSHVGLVGIATDTFWENRRTYATPEELREDILARTGRSILHELSDGDLRTLADTLTLVTTGMYPLTEHDRWTMWTATKPGTEN